jgi:predicted AAA+ superfamily ATPase
LTNIASLHSFSSIKKAFNIEVETVQEYIGYCENAFLLFFVSKFDRNLKVQAHNPKKVYCIDSGIRNVKSISEDIGKIAENVVFLELKRHGKEIYYHKDKYELDFVIVEKQSVKEMIQVCYSDLDNPDTYDRELAGILEGFAKYKVKEALLITKNRREIKKLEDGQKIKFVPLYEYLT